MTKILYLPTRYFPAISGAEFYIQRMAEIFNKNYHHDVGIFTSNALDFNALRHPSGKLVNKSKNNFNNVNNLRINRFPINYNKSVQEKAKLIKNIPSYKLLNLSDSTLNEFLRNGPFLEELLYIFTNSEQFNYDIIHTTFFPYFNILIALMIGKETGTPTVCTPFFHFSNPRYLNSTLSSVLKKFDCLIACTNLERKNLIDKIGIPEDKIDVIPMGVDHEKFRNIKTNTRKLFSFKKNFFKNKEKKYKMVLFCGYKNYEKGALSILKSIPHITQKYKKVYFIFIGPSTMAFNRELAKIKKKNNIRIINLTPDNLTGYYDKKKISAFKETDIFLMPSRSDAFGIAFLEAWAAGKPVIGANIGATPEVIKDQEDGLLVEFDNHLDIAEKVLYLLQNKKLSSKLGLSGKFKVIQNYSWEIIAEKTHQTYQKLIST